MSGTGKSDEEIAREAANKFGGRYDLCKPAIEFGTRIILSAIREARQHDESKSFKECNADAK